jgi:type IV secretion system protein VirB2
MKKLPLFLFFLISSPIFASASTGMPWETPLEVIKRSITGPVAMTICILAFVGSLGSLIFGGNELSGFTKTILMLVLAGAATASATSLVTTLFATSGAIL